MKRLIAALVLAGIIAASSAHAADADALYTLQLNSWVCKTAEDYDNALAQVKQGTSPWKLSKELYEQGKCIYMDDDNLEDMLAPFVQLHEVEGDKTKVSFFVEFYRRIQYLNREIKHIKIVGWTDTTNITYHRQSRHN